MERTLSDIHMCAHARSSITLAFRGHNRTLRVGGGGLNSLLRGLTRKTRGQNSEMSLNASLTQQINVPNRRSGSPSLRLANSAYTGTRLYLVLTELGVYDSKCTARILLSKKKQTVSTTPRGVVLLTSDCHGVGVKAREPISVMNRFAQPTTGSLLNTFYGWPFDSVNQL